MWWNIGFFVASLVISYMLRPPSQAPQIADREHAKPAGKGDFDFPTVSPGREIPVVFGTRWLKGPNVVWYGDLKTEPIKEVTKIESGDEKKK